MGWRLRNMLANPGLALTWWDQAVWAERLGYAQQDASLSAGGEIAAIDGFAFRIGQRAALVPTPGAKVYGLVFSITRSELGEELGTA
jgi:hypothetical protein